MAVFVELYCSSRWRRRTALQLKWRPMCERCEREGRTTAATLSHHLVPHNGDRYLFFYGALESLCFNCHLLEHGRAPMRDYETDVGSDGWPLDAAHPVYRTDAAKREAQQ